MVVVVVQLVGPPNQQLQLEHWQCPRQPVVVGQQRPIPRLLELFISISKQAKSADSNQDNIIKSFKMLYNNHSEQSRKYTIMKKVLTSSSGPSRFSGNRCISCPIGVSSPFRGPCSSEVRGGCVLSLWVLNGSASGLLLLFMLLGLLRVSIEEQIHLLHNNKTLCCHISDKKNKV